jgi:hypothetical protein
MTLTMRGKWKTATGVTLMTAAAFVAFGCESAGSRGPQQTWTIHVATIGGPDQHARTKQIAESLEGLSELDGGTVRVVHDSDGGQIYYGNYTRWWDARTEQWRYEPDPHEDLAFIKSLTYDGKTLPFATAMLMEDAPRVVSQPEWDAREADGYWSLQVAVFYNTESFQRRHQAAAEYCELLRQQGHEAYCYHGTRTSTVLVGAFPEDAVHTVQKETVNLRGERVNTAETVIAYRSLQALRNQFPHTIENGHVINVIQYDRKTGEEIRTPQPSLIVKLPRTDQPEEAAQW